MSTRKTPLLFLCHRIPFPPNKGDKIRSWHLLKHLARRHDIFLAAFIDDPADQQYKEALKEICKECFFQTISPSFAKIKSLAGLLAGQPLSVSYYRSRGLQEWVNQKVAEHKISDAVVFSSAMGQFLLPVKNHLHQSIIDFVDVDSDKWRQYAQRKKWPMSYIYRREGNKLLSYDKLLARHFDHSLFVSEKEAELFKSLAPESEAKISHYYNGVDVEYFSPQVQCHSPYPEGILAIVLTGAMDYWPNADAACWFAEQIFPTITEKYPNVLFYIAGGKPTRQVQQLGALPGVTVTGRVEDIRPYIRHASVVVAPMRIARGIQNKVLEAMAMEKTVVVTTQGLEGINASHGKEVLIADRPGDFAGQVMEALKGGLTIGQEARRKVLTDFNWDRNLAQLDNWIENNSPVKQVNEADIGPSKALI